MVRTCLSVNKASVQDENFFGEILRTYIRSPSKGLTGVIVTCASVDGIHEKHEIGWLVAGIACGKVVSVVHQTLQREQCIIAPIQASQPSSQSRLHTSTLVTTSSQSSKKIAYASYGCP